MLLFLLNADPLIVPVQSASEGGARVARMVESGIRIGFTVAVVVAMIEEVRDAVRLLDQLKVPDGWSPRRG